jgi:hypothetical protein
MSTVFSGGGAQNETFLLCGNTQSKGPFLAHNNAEHIRTSSSGSLKPKNLLCNRNEENEACPPFNPIASVKGFDKVWCVPCQLQFRFS